MDVDIYMEWVVVVGIYMMRVTMYKKLAAFVQKSERLHRNEVGKIIY
jgi:hypothetical protein